MNQKNTKKKGKKEIFGKKVKNQNKGFRSHEHFKLKKFIGLLAINIGCTFVRQRWQAGNETYGGENGGPK